MSRGHCAKLQGWPGGLPRGRGAHQGGRGGPRGRQTLLGSIIRSGTFLTYDGYAPVGLRYSNRRLLLLLLMAAAVVAALRVRKKEED